MAGEFSPDMMFLGVCQKVVCVVANGYKSIGMGANGCMGEEGSKNKKKRAINGRGRHFLRYIYTTKKKQEVCRACHGGQRGLFVGIEGRNGGVRCGMEGYK